jgi:hypothetical protein
VVEQGRGEAALKLKTGQTVARDTFQGNRFAKAAGDRVQGGAVVYGGSNGHAGLDAAAAARKMQSILESSWVRSEP